MLPCEYCEDNALALIEIEEEAGIHPTQIGVCAPCMRRVLDRIDANDQVTKPRIRTRYQPARFVGYRTNDGITPRTFAIGIAFIILAALIGVLAAIPFAPEP